ITADAWVEVQEGWVQRCNSGTGDTPWWSWRGIRTLTRKSGDYLSCFVQAIGEQKHTGADAVTTRFVVGRYWDLIEELSVSDLAAAYGDSDPDDDEDDFTVSDPHDEVPWCLVPNTPITQVPRPYNGTGYLPVHGACRRACSASICANNTSGSTPSASAFSISAHRSRWEVSRRCFSPGVVS